MAFNYNYPMGGSSRPPPAPAPGPLTYNISPKPQTGTGAVGAVPGNIGIPPNLYEGVQSIYPGLPGLTGGAGRVIQSELAGELSPETINSIQDEAARFGIMSGLPMTEFSGKRGLRSLGLNVEGRQRQGVQDYGNFLSSLASTATNPNLAAEIAAWNATMNAAPNPALATNAQLAAYWRALRAGGALGKSPAGGTTGGDEAVAWSNQNRMGEDDQMRRRQTYSDAWWNEKNPATATYDTGDGMSLEDWYGITYGEPLEGMNWSDFEEGW